MVTHSGKSRRVAKDHALSLLLDEGKMGLTRRELLVVDETHQAKYTVWVRKDQSGFWKVEIHVDENGRMYELDTTRGVTKGWRQLSDALLFVKDNCARAKDVFVCIDDWILRRTDDVE